MSTIDEIIKEALEQQTFKNPTKKHDKYPVRQSQKKFKEQLVRQKYFDMLHKECIGSFSPSKIREDALARREQQGRSKITFANNRAEANNFLTNMISETHKIFVGDLRPELVNVVGICQSCPRLYSMILQRLKNPLLNYHLYLRRGNGRSPKVIDHDYRRLPARVLEDLACYLLVRSNYGGKDEDSVLLMRQREKYARLLTRISEQQILDFNQDFLTLNNGKPFFQVGWYVFIASLVKRTYDIDVFAGSGQNFNLAYLLSSGSSLSVVQQAYNLFCPDVDGVQICSVEKYCSKKEEGHIETIIYSANKNSNSLDDIVVYLNNQRKLQIAFTEEDHILVAFCELLSDNLARINPDDRDSARHFSLIGTKLDTFEAFYEQKDIDEHKIPQGFY